MTHVRTGYLYMLGWVLLCVFMFVYVNEAKSDSVACVVKMQQYDSDSTAELRAESKNRFDALYDVLDQRLDPSNQKPIDSAEVQRAWMKFKVAHLRYNQLIDATPVPDPERIC